MLCESDPFLRVTGLKAGDEVLEINQRAAEELDSALLKDALVQPSLCLTVRTHPEPEEAQRLGQPPPRRSENPPEPGDSGLPFPGGSQGTGLGSQAIVACWEGGELQPALARCSRGSARWEVKSPAKIFKIAAQNWAYLQCVEATRLPALGQAVSLCPSQRNRCQVQCL